MDSGRLFSYGWRPKVSLDEGIRIAHADFLRRMAAGGLNTESGND
jgi:nucleoside-diphosphate-sugar epimerase